MDANVAELLSDCERLVTPRIRRYRASAALPRTPLQESFSYLASTPHLRFAGTIAIFTELVRVGDVRWFCHSAEEFSALAERLKLTPCPHCKAVGALNRHGFLYGFDDSSPRRKTVRARRIFCSNRNARPGCGRTFSVWCADKIRRLGLTAGCLWRFLQHAAAGCMLAAIRAADCHLSGRSMQRIWKRFELGQSKIRTALSARCPPPEVPPKLPARPARRPAAHVLAHLQAAFPDADCPIAAFQHATRAFFV